MASLGYKAVGIDIESRRSAIGIHIKKCCVVRSWVLRFNFDLRIEMREADLNND